MKIIEFKDIVDLYRKDFSSGRNNGKNPIRNNPFGKRYENEKFVLTKINPFKIKAIPRYKYLIEKYKEDFKNKKIPPIWVLFGKKMRNGDFYPFWDKMFQVKEGNHRSKVAKLLKLKEIDVYMPISHYNYIKDNCGDLINE